MKRKIITILFLNISFLFFGQNQLGNTILGNAEGDNSGSSVSISSDGSIVAIGSPHNNNVNGIRAGKVKVYKILNGTWIQIGNDMIGDNEFDTFGRSIGLSSDGNVIVIGAPYQDSNSDKPGYVKVFRNLNDNWVQIGSNIQGENPGDTFGHSLSISSNGSKIAVGAPNNDILGNQTGHVRVFENRNDIWEQIGIDIDGEEAFNFFGGSVSLSSDGDIVAVGAENGDGFFDNAGHVKVYKINGNNWEQIGANINGGNLLTSSFGKIVKSSADGNIIAVCDPFSPNNLGTVRVFKNNLNSWEQVGSDIVGDSSEDFFGASISLSSDGSILSVGNTGGFFSLGQVRIYKFSNGEWNQIGNNIDADKANIGFSSSLNLSSNGNILAIGAPFDNNSGIASGYVKIYNLDQVLNLGEYEFDKSVLFYPNPVIDFLNIELSKNLDSIEIYTIQGKLISSPKLNKKNLKINLSQFQSGVYIIKYSVNNKTFIKKFLKG
jgi:hypothetical protein